MVIGRATLILLKNPFVLTNRLISVNIYSNNFNKFSSNNMQTSITAFFKTKAPAKQEDTAQSDENIECFGIDDSAMNSTETTREITKTKKQPFSDSDDDDDEGNIVTAKNKKRRALSSTETTPVKGHETSSATSKQDDQAEAGDTAGDADHVKSPARSTSQASKQLMAQSPLFSVEALIKKKISSGAYALHENIGMTWFRALQAEFDKPYFKKLSAFLQQQRQNKTVFPPPEQVFTWTHHHPILDTRVVIIGQDPYHGPNQAHGLSFSVQKGIAVPKSLQNIYKELQSDIPDFNHPGHGNLTGWSKQGVLMLNACLTVSKGEANSHQGKGWETFTDAVISWISKNVKHNIVFLLWGRFAQRKSAIIDKRHKILESAHPSPFSAESGFFGCKHFSQTNAHLRSQKIPEIDWKAL